MPILVPLPTRNVPASLGFTFCQALVHETGSEHEAARDIQLGGSSDFVYEMLLFSGIIPARKNVSAKKTYRAQYEHLNKVREINYFFLNCAVSILCFVGGKPGSPGQEIGKHPSRTFKDGGENNKHTWRYAGLWPNTMQLRNLCWFSQHHSFNITFLETPSKQNKMLVYPLKPLKSEFTLTTNPIFDSWDVNI